MLEMIPYNKKKQEMLLMVARCVVTKPSHKEELSHILVQSDGSHIDAVVWLDHSL